MVLILRPSGFFQGTISDLGFRFHRDEFLMKVPVSRKLIDRCVCIVLLPDFHGVKGIFIVKRFSFMLFLLQITMLSTLDELHNYVRPEQLTQEFGGSYDYDHKTWMRNRVVSIDLLNQKKKTFISFEFLLD